MATALGEKEREVRRARVSWLGKGVGFCTRESPANRKCKAFASSVALIIRVRKMVAVVSIKPGVKAADSRSLAVIVAFGRFRNEFVHWPRSWGRGQDFRTTGSM